VVLASLVLASGSIGDHKAISWKETYEPRMYIWCQEHFPWPCESQLFIDLNDANLSCLYIILYCKYLSHQMVSVKRPGGAD